MLGKLIGVGGFSRVYEYIDDQDTDSWIKIIASNSKITSEKASRIVFNEGLVMEQLGTHPNIIKLISAQPSSTVCLNGRDFNASFLILEKCKNGTLANVIRKTGPLEESVAWFIFVQILSGIQFMHDKGFAHLDIKLENILLDEFFNVKISDFGTSEYVDESFGFTTKECGTKGYMAPEITSNDRDDNYDAYSADIYSLGVWLNLLLTGQFPSENQTMSKNFTTNSFTESELEDWDSSKMFVEVENQPPTMYDHLSDDVRLILEEMLDHDPWNRPFVSDIKNSDWINQKPLDEIASIVFQEMNARVEYISNLNEQPIISF